MAAPRLRRPNVRLIGLRNLILDESIQSRVGMDMEWSRQLSEFRRDGAVFPPIGVVQTRDGRYLVWSGYHRSKGAELAGDQQILCEITECPPGEDPVRLARILSAGSNKSNGVKPMTKKDLKKAAEMLFADEEWLVKSPQVIAEHVGCCSKSITRWRVEFCERERVVLPEEVVDRAGRRYSANANRCAKGRVPRITTDARGQKTTCIGGRRYHIPRDPSSAAARRDELAEAYRLEQETRQRSLGGNAIRAFLVADGIACELSGQQGTTGIGVYLRARGCVVVPSEVDAQKSSSLRDPIAIAVLARARHDHRGRTVIVCYDPPACEALDIAREKLGIEFLTPEELVVSLRGAAGPDEGSELEE